MGSDVKVKLYKSVLGTECRVLCLRPGELTEAGWREVSAPGTHADHRVRGRCLLRVEHCTAPKPPPALERGKLSQGTCQDLFCCATPITVGFAKVILLTGGGIEQKTGKCFWRK